MESRSGENPRAWKCVDMKTLYEPKEWWGPELYLFSVTVSGPRAMSGPPKGGPVVVKVSSGIHLMLSKSRTSASVSNYPNLHFGISQVTGRHLPREWRTWQFWLFPRSSLSVTQGSCSYQLHNERVSNINNATSHRQVSHITDCGLTDDGHQGVEVANVETLSGNIDEELDHLGPLLLLCRLKKGDICFCKYWRNYRAIWSCSNTKWTLGGSNALRKYKSIAYTYAEKSAAVIKYRVIKLHLL